ncbi:MAG: trimethylamine methyltransferase family protein, partial [Chloroflexi bacterium]|nr:trimethylamine methyltransferase family protein [Chloroflexota bacterium]
MSPLSFLSAEDIEAIHTATLRILDETGILLTHPEARTLLDGAGATILQNRVLLPPELVESSLALCPPTFTLRGRGGNQATLGGGELHWHNLGGAPNVYDPVSNQRRPATVADVQDAARLLDALPNCTTVTPFFTPQDVPGEIMLLAMYRHTLPHTLKPVHGPGLQNAAEVGYLARMAEVIGPPPEVLSLGISPISPLTFPDETSAAILATARPGIPFGPLPCPMAGATAPLSLAGALAQQNAEVLAAIVLAQLAHPGLPVYYCGRLAVMEPRTGGSVWGGVELGLISATTVQIAHRYRLPVNVYGLSTNAHDLSLQNGFERALNAAIPALAGADELSGIGEMAAGVTGACAQMVLDDEIAAGVRRLRHGITVNEDSLAVSLIAAVMNGPGNFLSERHTVRYLRGGEIFIPQLAERRGWDEWLSDGQGMAERAQA